MTKKPLMSRFFEAKMIVHFAVILPIMTAMWSVLLLSPEFKKSSTYDQILAIFIPVLTTSGLFILGMNTAKKSVKFFNAMRDFERMSKDATDIQTLLAIHNDCREYARKYASHEVQRAEASKILLTIEIRLQYEFKY